MGDMNLNCSCKGSGDPDDPEPQPTIEGPESPADPGVLPPHGIFGLPHSFLLKVLRCLNRKDLLRARLVKHLVPQDRDIRLALWILEENKHLIIGMNLSSKFSKDMEYAKGAEFDITKNRYGESDASVPGFVIRYEFDNDDKFSLSDIPESLVQKTHFLTVGIREPVLDYWDSTANLEPIQKHCTNLKSICVINAEFLNLGWIMEIVKNNKNLIKGCFMKAEASEGYLYNKLHIIDMNNISECHDMKELTVIKYPTQNIVKLPKGINHLILQSPIPLENVVWLCEYKDLRVLGLVVDEIVMDKDLLKHMSEGENSSDAFALTGLVKPTPEGEDVGLLDMIMGWWNEPGTKGTFTPELFKKLLELPHLEHLMIEFVPKVKGVGLDAKAEVDQLEERWNPMKKICEKTPGIYKTEFQQGMELSEADYKFWICIAIDRQTFKRLLK